MSNKLLFRLAVLVAAMMCALGIHAQEAYACYTSSNTTLTFYYDNLRSTRSGTTYDLNTGSNNPAWYRDGTYSSVVQVVFDPLFADALPTTTYRWFYDMSNLQSITGIQYLNTTNVTNMGGMFCTCSSLTSLDLSSFNTTNVTNMNTMFDNCSGLTSLNVSSFNTANVTEMYAMFDNCSSLTSLDLSNFNTSQVIRMANMFSRCSSLTSLDVSSFNTSNVTSLNTMFLNCSGLTSLDLSSFNTSKVTSMNQVFYGCSGLTSLDLSSFNTTNVTKMSEMFRNCSGLTSLDLSSFNTENVTDMHYMFYGCSGLTNLDVSNFNTEKVTDMHYMFRDCNGLTSLNLSSFNTSHVTDMHNMFYGCSGLKTIYVGDSWSTAAVTNSAVMFKNCTSLVGGKGTTYDASHVDAAYAHIDGGPDNPGYFTDADAVVAYTCYTPDNTTLTFYNDKERSRRPGTTYDLNTGDDYPDWYSDGTNSSVTQVVFDPSFADARPTTTCDWFRAMFNLQTITGMSYLNTSEVTNMAFMFSACNQLTSIEVSGFNTANVTNMNYMFFYCSGLTSLDLSSFNTSKVTNMQSMFEGSTNLRTIYVGSDWSTAAVTSSANMFYNCTSLVGGKGTTYDANHIGKAYAHIDGGPSNPGYFTDKNASQRGDVNGDNKVNIVDVTALINYLLGDTASSINLTAADCNTDGNITITDVTALINYLLGGTW